MPLLPAIRCKTSPRSIILFRGKWCHPATLLKQWNRLWRGDANEPVVQMKDKAHQRRSFCESPGVGFVACSWQVHGYWWWFNLSVFEGSFIQQIDCRNKNLGRLVLGIKTDVAVIPIPRCLVAYACPVQHDRLLNRLHQGHMLALILHCHYFIIRGDLSCCTFNTTLKFGM